MPIPAALLPALSMATGAAQTLIGAGGLLGNRRPRYEVPESVKEAMTIARIKAADPLVSGYSQAKGNIDLAAANALQQAQQVGGAQEALGSIVGQAEAGYRNLAQLGEQSQERDMMNLQQMLQQMSQYEDMQFQMNEFAPYAQKFQLFSDMIGGGLENIMQGADKSLMVPQQETQGQPGGMDMDKLLTLLNQMFYR